MATLLSPWSLLPTNNNLKPQQQQPPTNLTTTITFPPQKHPLSLTNLTTTLTAATTTFLILTTPTPSLADTTYTTYYGTAASAANYGGYGGNSSKKDSAEYIYDVPSGWKERLVSKVEKGTNGTDSEFYNPKKKTEKEYLTFLSGFRQLAPKDVILNNLALSDVNLQDQIASADKVTAEERKDESGQVYYDYEIDGVGSHSLISVTCAKNKLYAHFVNAPAPEWNRDQEMLRSRASEISDSGPLDHNHAKNQRQPAAATLTVSEDEASIFYWKQMIKISEEGSHERADAEKELADLISHRKHIDESLRAIVKVLVVNGQINASVSSQLFTISTKASATDWKCVKTMVANFQAHCGTLRHIAYSL